MSHVLYIVSMIHMIRESSLSSMQPPCVAAAQLHRQDTHQRGPPSAASALMWRNRYFDTWC